MNPSPYSPPTNLRRTNQGVALILTLALVVLVTAVVVAFFARVTGNQAVELSRSNRVVTEQLAMSASDYVVGQFVEEIVSPVASRDVESNGQHVYLPLAAEKMVPLRAIASAIPPTDAGYFNLLRQSVAGADANASGDSTATAAKNGRIISPVRWNAPCLFTGSSGITTVSQVPHWIYLNKNGEISSVMSKETIGRFAYNVYDVGGLLDINAAGYDPAKVVGPSRQILKSSMAGAQLSQILGATPGTSDALGESNATAFVNWRNGGSNQSQEEYLKGVKAAAQEGFLVSLPGDKRIVSRQDLIKLADTGTYGISRNSLPYFTAFSRFTTAPSVIPPALGTAERPASTGNDAGGNDDKINPAFPLITVKNVFTRADGGAAVVGEPLVKKRFPLDKLALLQSAPNRVLSSSEIYTYFGLVRNSPDEPWIYNHGGAGILRLEDVAELNREPDFFELLKAAILCGSLGASYGNSRGGAYIDNLDRSIERNIFQIGASLIDQYDSDSLPCVIAWGSPPYEWMAYGVENLPYLTRVRIPTIRLSQPNEPTQTFAMYIQPEIVNPHDTTYVPSDGSLPGAAPTRFRVVAGGVERYPGPGSLPFSSPVTVQARFKGSGTLAVTVNQTATIHDNNTGIEFGSPAASTFAEPKLLAYSGGAEALAASPGNRNTTGATAPMGNWVGMYLTSGTGSVTGFSDSGTSRLDYVIANGNANGLSLKLQYLSPSTGSWITYFQRANLNLSLDGAATNNGGSPLPNSSMDSNNTIGATTGIDARSDRFSSNGMNTIQTVLTMYPFGSAMRPGAKAGTGGWLNPPTSSAFHVVPADPPSEYGHTGMRALGGLSQNIETGSLSYYSDPDGIVRGADGFYNENNGTSVTGLMGAVNNHPSRPIILNRPFRSVAEMGYAFRGIAFKSVDFFTAKSGDHALLDVFTITDEPSSGVVGGRVSAYTRQGPVLQALASGAVQKEGNPVSTISGSDASKVAAKLIALTSGADGGTGPQPLRNRGELATKWIPRLSDANVGSIMGGSSNLIIKRQREAPLRGVTDVLETRSWNLLADIIVQSGQMVSAPGASGSQFSVSGEQRNWVHVAIDRISGQVIAQQKELVHE